MTYDTLWHQLSEIYPAGEAKAVARYLLEVGFGFTPTDIYCDKITQLSPDDETKLIKMLSRLMDGEPVQYVTGMADFAGRQFKVAPGVLIPRPETAELCGMIADFGGHDILDIGTGSGCIAVTLAADIGGSRVTAWDISDDALSIARGNAQMHGVCVDFVKTDALNPPADAGIWDVVVSNPPYICDRERSCMDHNVLDYEPQTALFVPDSDPLLFYRAIAGYSAKALRHGGRLYFEINALYPDEVCGMLRQKGYADVKAHDDMFGKKRFVTATKQ